MRPSVREPVISHGPELLPPRDSSCSPSLPLCSPWEELNDGPLGPRSGRERVLTGPGTRSSVQWHSSHAGSRQGFCASRGGGSLAHQGCCENLPLGQMSRGSPTPVSWCPGKMEALANLESQTSSGTSRSDHSSGFLDAPGVVADQRRPEGCILPCAHLCGTREVPSLHARGRVPRVHGFPSVLVGSQGLTMVLRTIVTWLRLRGVLIHTFLDILLLVGCSVEEVLRALALTSRPQ